MILMEEVLETLKLNYEQFVELCILFGCDYCDRLHDLKPEVIYKYFSKNKNIPDTLKLMKQDNIRIPDMSDYNIYKEYFMNPPINKIDNITMKKCDITKLEKLLVSKYGLVKMKIEHKLQFLDKYLY